MIIRLIFNWHCSYILCLLLGEEGENVGHAFDDALILGVLQLFRMVWLLLPASLAGVGGAGLSHLPIQFLLLGVLSYGVKAMVSSLNATIIVITNLWV